MHRQNPDTHEAELYLLSSSALAARAERVLRIKALVDAGLYRADAGAIARGLLRDGRRMRAARRSDGARRSLDTRVTA